MDNFNSNITGKKRFCYWAVADKDFAFLLKNLVKSARVVGVEDDFHAWSDKNIDGAVTHRLDLGDIARLNTNSLFPYEFKFKYLKKMLSFDYDYYVYIDSDMHFAKKPPTSPLVLLKGDPLHLFLDTNLDASAHLIRSEWWGCPLRDIVQAMRDMGVKNKKIYNLNGGFWVISRQHVHEILHLVYKFWGYLRDKGYPGIADEIPLSYAMHMLCHNLDEHLLCNNLDYFGNCNSRDRVTAERILNGQPWIMKDNFTGKEELVNPAIVHCICLKDALMEIYLGYPWKITYRIKSLFKKIAHKIRRIVKQIAQIKI